MRDGKLNNKQVEDVLNALFAAEPARGEAIDQIVDDPDLFAGVQRRIAAMSAKPPRRSAFSIPRLAAYAGMGVTGCIAIAAVILSSSESSQTAKVAPAPDRPAFTAAVSAPSAVPPQPTSYSTSADRVDKGAPRAERTVLVSRPRQRRVEPEKAVEVPTERFLPVAYTGDPSETAGGGQIIRVELKRSALFAMGVNVPLENDDPVVKAELLVGRDGVTRAVRLVD